MSQSPVLLKVAICFLLIGACAAHVRKSDTIVSDMDDPQSPMQLRREASRQYQDRVETHLRLLVKSKTMLGKMEEIEASFMDSVHCQMFVPTQTARMTLDILRDNAPEGVEKAHWYAAMNDNEINPKLIRQLEEVNKEPKNPMKSGMNTLHFAAKYGNKDVVEAVIGALEKDTDKIDEVANYPPGATALYFAVGKGDEDVFNVLKTSNANFDMKLVNGRTMYHIAAQTGQTFVFDDDTVMHTKMNEPDNHGVRPLHLAAQEGRIDIYESLKPAVHLLKDMVDRDGNNVFHYAARQGHDDIMARIFNDFEGENEDAQAALKEMVNAQNNDMDTPLHLACARSFSSTGRLLIGQGAEASLTITNVRKQTPFHIAMANTQIEDPEFNQFLLKNGADLTAVDEDGNTAFHLAIKAQNQEYCAELMQVKDINLNVKNNKGETVAEMIVAAGGHVALNTIDPNLGDARGVTAVSSGIIMAISVGILFITATTI